MKEIKQVLCKIEERKTMNKKQNVRAKKEGVSHPLFKIFSYNGV